MGKKRIIQKADSKSEPSLEQGVAAAITAKKKLSNAAAHIFSTYNNTVISITDLTGNVIVSASAGSLGFSGTKKSTPYAATKVAEFLGEKSKAIGIKNLKIFIKGIGAGRDSALRSFAAQGFDIESIRDVTPIPFNGPKPAKPRRV